VTHYARVGSLRLRVRRSGEGTPLLLVNGIGAPLEMWEPFVRELSGFEVITFDMPGCGLSSHLRRPVRMRALVGVVDELMRVIGRSHADVLGYSHGGLLAQELAYRRPHRVDRLVLCATTPGIPSAPPNPLVAWMMLTPARYYDPRLAKAMLPVIAGGRTRRDPQALRAQIDLRLLHPPSIRGYLHQLYATAGWTSYLWLRRIRQRTLVVHGDEDPLIPIVNARNLARRIPDATLHVMRGAGHLLLMDEAPTAARVIRGFLR
jgi:poly(3-hydroxyalkanoate) depolymerase